MCTVGYVPEYPSDIFLGQCPTAPQHRYLILRQVRHDLNTGTRHFRKFGTPTENIVGTGIPYRTYRCNVSCLYYPAFSPAAGANSVAAAPNMPCPSPALETPTRATETVAPSVLPAQRDNEAPREQDVDVVGGENIQQGVGGCFERNGWQRVSEEMILLCGRTRAG